MDAIAIPDSHQIVWGRLIAYNQSAHTATVALRRQPGAALINIPVLSALPGELLIAEQEVAIALMPTGAGLLLGPIIRPVWPKSADVDDAATQTFNSTSFTAWPGKSLSIVHTVTSYVLIWCSFSYYPMGTARGWHGAATVYVDGADSTRYALMGGNPLSAWGAYTIHLRTAAKTAGTRTIVPYIRIQNAGDSAYGKYLHLTALLTPA